MNAEMPKSETQEVNRFLIQLILRDEGDEDFISVLLVWISGDSLPPSEHLKQGPAQRYINKLWKTAPSAFADAFLDFVRTQSARIVAQCQAEDKGKEQANSSPPASLVLSEIARKGRELSISRSAQIKTLPESAPNIYDAEFPVLGSSNSNSQGHLKPRRVNPTPMESPSVNSAFVFANVEPSQQNNGSISRNQSVAPLKFDMDVLMKRREKRKSKPTASEVKVCNQSCNAGASEQPVKDGATGPEGMNSAQSLSVLKGKTAAVGDSKAVQSWSVVSTSTLSKLRRFATVHSKLVNERLVPSLIGELHYLFQLLNLGQSTRQQSGLHTLDDKLFGCGNDCSLYACIVMEFLGRLLDSVGEPLLSALVNHPMISGFAPALMMQIKQSLARHQASTLRSFKPYAGTHTKLADLRFSVSLPFQAERDSRNYYKGHESQKLYNNRELCRDVFYAIIREASFFQNSFGHTLEDARLKIQERVRELMNNLMIENYPWFTELFLEHLVQVAICGETDPTVADFAQQDPIKLQKLHDRLVLGRAYKPSRPPQFILPGNRGSNAGDCRVSAPILKSHSNNCGTLAGMEVMAMFPQALRVYIWIVEAADCYRLGVQMIGSLKSKICEMTEIPQHSRDSAEIGSVLTQRVLSLKALAGLLGFLSSFPWVGSQSLGFGGERFGLDPPIDVEHALEVAVKNETLLLTLPWILDYLQLIKVDQYAVRSPYFQKSLEALRNLYKYSILDPKNDRFGAPSICILSLLDSFFEWVDLLEVDGNVQYKPGQSRGLDDSTLDAKQGQGLDRLKGVVDASYIQQCCPSLMELRLLLTNNEEHPFNKKTASKLSIPRVKSLRKITPIHNPKGIQIFNQGSSIGPCEEMRNVECNGIQTKLEHSFFKQHQELQRLVDFVVDTVAVNAAIAASLRCVPPILEEGLKTLETTLAQAPASNEEAFWPEIRVEAEVETIITSCIHKALPLAIEYAKKHTAERTAEAVALLANPDERPFVLGIAGKIAADLAASAASQKTLANISCEIRKKITQELESWRRRFQNALKFNSEEERMKQLFPIGGADVAPETQDLDQDNKENMENFCNIAHKDTLSKQGITCEVFQARADYAQLTCNREISSLIDKALCCCAVVIDCCENSVKVDNQRHLLRVKLAGIATALENMISSKYDQMPPGGFDSLIYPVLTSGPRASGESPIEGLFHPIESAADIRFKIERGLAKRCVALAFHFFLLSPCETFGFESDALEQCRCFTKLGMESKDARHMFSIMKDSCRELVKDERRIIPDQAIGNLIEPSAAESNNRLARKTPTCKIKDHIGGLMSGLLTMCVALEKCGLCDSNFLLLEFFSSWRWSRALLSKPWKASGVWFQAVKHGVASVLTKFISEAHTTSRTMESILRCFETFFGELCGTKPEKSTSFAILDEGKENLQNLRVVVIFIFLEMFELDFVQRSGNDIAASYIVEIINQIKGGFRETVAVTENFLL
ncbi:hypothetical protein L7F22_054561 [Adiantum nelumboides]|nr:hypothetical protein [Adiantum nelumboides]